MPTPAKIPVPEYSILPTNHAYKPNYTTVKKSRISSDNEARPEYATNNQDCITQTLENRIDDYETVRRNLTTDQ